jgi:BMFP domain-containing protein YqiC
MENTNTFFDTWMDAQTKMTKNWVETNEKLQKTALGGEMLEKGSELYKEWLEKQKSLLNNLMGQQPAATAEGETATETSENPFGANFFQNWLKTQNETSQKFMDSSRTYFDNFFKGQFQAANPWTNVNPQQNWMGSFNSMFDGMNKAFAELPKFMNPATSKDAFNSMLKSTELYTKLYDMWQPFLQNMPKGAGVDAESLKKMFDPAGYKEIVDKMFGFAPANNLTELFEQASRNIHNYFHATRQMGDSYLNAFGKERDLLEGMMPSGAGYINEMYRGLYNNFRQSMMPFFRLAAPGNEQEQLDTMFDLQEKLVNYSVKQNEMQYLIYTNAGKAWNNVMDLLRTRAEEKKEYANFQEFYAEWSDINEKIFINLFSTEEFSRLQGEVIGLSLDLKKGFETQMEAMLQPFPVVLRSQMEEVYRNNYELRKELRALAKTVKELQNKVEAGNTKPAEKTTEVNGTAAAKTATAPATASVKK